MSEGNDFHVFNQSPELFHLVGTAGKLCQFYGHMHGSYLLLTA